MHDHLYLDERHAALLTPIVIAWVAWFLAARWCERRGHGVALIVLATAVPVVMLAFSPWLAAYFAQWPLVAAVGVWSSRGPRAA